MKIVVVEDDSQIRELIVYFLQKEKYDVVASGDGYEAIKLIAEIKPDLLILDLMLPNLSGIDITKIVRDLPEKYGNPLIIMVTAKTETDDVIKGLEAGANEYIRKPFDPRELIARIKNIMKRTGKKINKQIEFGDILIDESKYIVYENKNEVELSKKEYELLKYFIINKDMILTREKLLNEVWGVDYFPGDRVIDVYVGKIRGKFKILGENLKTVKGVGYKLIEKKF
ncbi:response regulator [Haliovirga abyssi]|uniref:DNA-binding response regulator n=1 Tax=Haliovirga abyssi TaxID=2996794 RepID=A0AAU9DGK9_9FUSO|nr:response regulator transcription factor [Haliovirga abyssi]BDU49829.1 DNA-binding response regulator [Haliovirga abyssi]